MKAIKYSYSGAIREPESEGCLKIIVNDVRLIGVGFIFRDEYNEYRFINSGKVIRRKGMNRI